MVCNIITNVIKGSIASPSTKRVTEKSIRLGPPTSGKQISSVSGLDGFRQLLATEGISEQAARLISNCRRTGTTFSWCCQRKVDPFQCPLNFVLDYLADLFAKDFEYRSINVHRSAISAYHEPIDGFKVGKHPKVCALLGGVFNNRPPKPRYTFVWDVDKVLEYLKGLDSATLSDKLLTVKLTMLLSLTAASRCSELKYLDIII